MLTPAQKATLLTHIQATPAALALYELGDLQGLADFYNAASNPAFIVWRPDVSTAEIRSVLVWAEYDTLSVSKQNAFAFLCSNHIVDATLPNVRTGIGSIFGAPQQAGNLAALTALAKRTASRIEALLATGTGTAQSPGTMTFVGTVTFADFIGL